MKPGKGAKMKYGRSPYAIVPPRRGENKFSSRQYGERPYFCTKIQKPGIFIIHNFVYLRFPRSTIAKFL